MMRGLEFPPTDWGRKKTDRKTVLVSQVTTDRGKNETNSAWRGNSNVLV